MRIPVDVRCTPLRGDGVQRLSCLSATSPSGATAWMVPLGSVLTAKRPKKPAVRRLAHRQSRLLVIVDPPPGPWPAALRSSVRSPGTVPEIAPQASSAVNVGPFGQDLEYMFEASRTRDLSTNWWPASRTCAPNPRVVWPNVEKPDQTRWWARPDPTDYDALRSGPAPSGHGSGGDGDAARAVGACPLEEAPACFRLDVPLEGIP